VTVVRVRPDRHLEGQTKPVDKVRGLQQRAVHRHGHRHVLLVDGHVVQMTGGDRVGHRAAKAITVQKRVWIKLTNE
jgi:hypothetical protein